MKKIFLCFLNIDIFFRDCYGNLFCIMYYLIVKDFDYSINM